MAHWLLKSEAESYGWDDLVRDGTTEWDGVRNAAAAKHLRGMAVGDQAIFYHSGKEKAAVGIATITRTARADGEDGRWVSVQVAPDRALPKAVTLAAMKAEAGLSDLPMLRQSRLSVSPVGEAEWTLLMAMAGL
ncbi:EVE domain-containing protein [Sphingomonas sanguinis]|uniref:EVE domain-containing protein n=1 Tax=Sphingomonas sp. LC-1 TaxID=3110957 RepID=UPI0021BB34BB|nr:EVE domain-containing protein [Sphingomonas sp. LC-1]MCT8002598.1 EVE domain-containing protein [Sphingomonas sp. LC-1]